MSAQKIPVIRYVSAELVYDDCKTKRYLTEDFTLDYDDDAFYSLNMFEVTDGITLESVPPMAVLDGEVEGGSVDSFTFYINEQAGFVPLNIGILTVMANAGPTISDPEQIINPFGSFVSIPDKMDALRYGSKILAQIANLEPYAKAQ